MRSLTCFCTGTKMHAQLDVEGLMHTAVKLAQNARNRLPEAFDELPTPGYVTDAEGVLTYYNRACILFSGRTPRVGEDKWCVTWELYTADGHRLPHDECPMATAIHERRPVRGVEAIALRPDGTHVLFQPSPTPLYDKDGDFIGAINILVDIGDRKPARPLWTEAARYRRLAKSILDERAAEDMDALATAYESGALNLARDPTPEVSPGQQCTNEILKVVAGDRLDFLKLFTRVSLNAGEILVWANQPIQHAYFLESGLATVVMSAGSKHPEIAMFGKEGMAGHCVLLGVDRSPHTVSMQVGGCALQISIEDLRHQMDLTPLLRERLLLFVNEFSNQIAETCCANALHSVENRLARWLLMVTERMGPELNLTHAAIAGALGSRRAGVTMAMHELEGEKAIKSTRSRIVVIDRAKLAEIAERGSTAALHPKLH
jgi:PAS domain S-box-containing protein